MSKTNFFGLNATETNLLKTDFEVIELALFSQEKSINIDDVIDIHFHLVDEKSFWQTILM